MKKFFFVPAALAFFFLSAVGGGRVSAATLVDTLVTDLRDQVQKNCPEKTDLAKAKEQEFGACVQPKFTACTATKPDDPLSCADPAATQCRSIIDEFLKTCSAAPSPCPQNEERKDGACVCQTGYERVDGVCTRALGNKRYSTEVIEFRVMKMTIKSISGDVRIQLRGKPEMSAQNETEITEGDEIFTGFDSHVVLVTDQGDVILLKASTQIRIATKDDKRFEIKLEKGEIKSEIKITGPTRPDVRIQTPTATASVRGTVFLVQALTAETSAFLVSKGTVVVTNNATNEESTVTAGQKLVATTNSLGKPEPLTVQDNALFADNAWFTSNRLLILAAGVLVVLVVIGALLLKRKKAAS